jgi:hypothetical protein
MISMTYKINEVFLKKDLARYSKCCILLNMDSNKTKKLNGKNKAAKLRTTVSYAISKAILHSENNTKIDIASVVATLDALYEGGCTDEMRRMVDVVVVGIDIALKTRDSK